jgi:hypothetical protein
MNNDSTKNPYSTEFEGDPLEYFILLKRKLMRSLQDYPDHLTYTGQQLAEIDLIKQNIRLVDEEIDRQQRIKDEHIGNQAQGKKKPKGRKPGRPNSTKDRNKLVAHIQKKLKCSFSDPRFWPTFEARAEDIISVPGFKGLGKCKWSFLSEDDRDKAHNTVIRQYREHKA